MAFEVHQSGKRVSKHASLDEAKAAARELAESGETRVEVVVPADQPHEDVSNPGVTPVLGSSKKAKVNRG